ncbi:mucin-2-like [Scylla paramamosain]|uniref:mucin-2-like n=1 Tax=Scylla paramamosain TaxID=85552 RepID=UPI0030827C06
MEGTAASPSRLPRLMVLLVTLSGAALLALNVAIVGCFVRRRALNRRASASSSTKNVAVDVYGVTPASTPGLHHSDNHLSLTTMTPSLQHSTPPPYQDEQQTSLDDLDTKGIVVPTAAPTHDPTPRLNGVLLGQRPADIPPPTSAVTVAATITTTAPVLTAPMSSDSGKTMTGRIQSPSITTTITTSTAPSVTGKSPRRTPLPVSALEEGSAIPTSTYDALQQHQLQQNPDQVSLTSLQSEYSRGYEYAHPHLQHYHPVCPHHHHVQQHHHHQHHAYTPTLYQTPASDQAFRAQSREREVTQPSPAYSGLNPSGLCSLRGTEQDPTATLAPPSSLSSLLPGSPASYATLGPRKRKPMPSKFASLPRSRPSNAPAHSHAPRLPQPDVTPVPTQAVEGVCRQPLQSFHVPAHTHAPLQSHAVIMTSTPHAYTNVDTQMYTHMNPHTQIYTHTHPHTCTQTFTNPHTHVHTHAHARSESLGYTQVLPVPQTRVQKLTEDTDAQRCDPSIQVPVSRTPESQQVHTQPQYQETPTQRPQRSGSITQYTAGQKRTESPVQRTQSPIQRTQSPIQRTQSPVQHVQSPIQRTQPPMIRSNSLTRRPETSHHHHHHHHKNAKASRPTTQDVTLTTITPTTPTTTSTPATSSSGDGGRPRFPHDFVRQNSLRSKGENTSGGGGGGGEHGKEKGESASASVSAASNHR